MQKQDIKPPISLCLYLVCATSTVKLFNAFTMIFTLFKATTDHNYSVSNHNFYLVTMTLTFEKKKINLC